MCGPPVILSSEANVLSFYNVLSGPSWNMLVCSPPGLRPVIVAPDFATPSPLPPHSLSIVLRSLHRPMMSIAHSLHHFPPSASSPTPAVSLCILFIVWWSANNLFALHAHHILAANADVPHLFLDLSLAQLLLGVCMSYFFIQFTSRFIAVTNPAAKPASPKPIHSNYLLSRHLYSSLALITALFHLAGTQLTNASYALIGSTSTLVWKLTEPMTAVCLKRVILLETISPTSFIGIILVMLGALLFSAVNLSISFSPVILANLFIPLRNILLKRQQCSPSQPSSSAQTYFLLSLQTLPFGLVCFLLKNVLFGFHMPPLLPLLQNALLYNLYQLASIALLERMDVLTHSLCNTIKRFSAIAISAFVTGEQLTVARFFALVLIVIGFPLHVTAKNKLHVRFGLPGMRFAWASGVLTFLFILSAIAAWSFGYVHEAVQQLCTSNTLHTQRDQHSWLSSRDSTLVSNAADVAVQHGEQYNARKEHSPDMSAQFVISQAGQYISTNEVYHTEEEALKFPDSNSGNMIWQYGGYMKLVDFTHSVTCNDTHVNCNRKDPSMQKRRMVHYRPAANGFNSKMNLSFNDAYERLEYEGDVVLYVGIGVQYAFQDDEANDDMFKGKRIENSVHTFRFTPQALDFLKTMNDLRIPMFMRGDFTVSASRLAGYKYGVSTGCPSLFINEEVHLGAVLEEKYRQLTNGTKKWLKIAFNLTGRYRMLKWMKAMADEHAGSLFYAQGPEDFRVLRNHNISFDRVRFFGNVADWVESLSHMDVSIGPRIHGNMAAIAAGVPSLIVAPDFRVMEMAQRMKIPHRSMFDERLRRGMDVVQLLSSVEFDGRAFDANRCAIAKLYAQHLGGFGIELSQHVKRISRIC
eukprot:TRINITY_DN3661_c0_g1_i1.p1 TRINITY_DN3661_c0_g1~~TRINITY_DN3661_c0_g1_i1.p1  ORF type:complete len:865 (+),score=129.76 TRINITY_DN3661_c0_g1_i1:129-2723(+)